MPIEDPTQNQNPDPNQNQNQADLNNQQQSSQFQQQQSNTPTAVYDPRFDRFAQQQSEVNRAILERLERLTTNTQPPPPPPPQFSEEEFRENPASALASLVDHRMNTAVDKLKNDILGQLAPVNQFIAQTQRTSILGDFINQLKQNPSFGHLNDPRVEQMFRQFVSTFQGNLDYQNAANLYTMAVGAVTVNLGPIGQNNPINQQQSNQPPPAHIRPDPRPNGNNTNVPTIPPFNENEITIMKQRGWSPARAAYGFGKITGEQYLKLEPNGKLIPGMP